MQKLKLDALEVETFEATSQAVDPLRGTVEAYALSVQATACCPYNSYVAYCALSRDC